MMSLRPFALVFIAAFGLSACMSDPPSRGQTGSLLTTPLTTGLLTAQGAGVAGLAVTKINVAVPRSLKVSEENSYIPAADIVWHGEAPGDRYAQVQAIFDAAMARGLSQNRQGRPVVVDVVVTRFHALTDRTRQSVGGMHNLKYQLTVRDAATGAVLVATHQVNASVRGSGGGQAKAEEAVGRTQKVVITEALMASIQKELRKG